MIAVPVQAAPSQTLTVILSGQNCQINLYQKLGILYFDLYVGNSPIATGVQCESGNRLVRYKYRGFVGDFIWQDTLGQDDPEFEGLGTRFVLQYLEASDLSALGFAAQ